MRETISEAGVWWTPDAPDRRLSGSLTFNPSDGAVLAVMSEGGAQSFQNEDRAYPIIYGRTTSGKDLTLIHCFDQGSQTSLGGIGRSERIERREIYANLVLAGFHLPSVDGPHIAEARVSYRLLARWMLLRSGIKVEDDHTGLGLSVRYEPPSPIEINGIPGVRLSIESLLKNYPMGASWDGEIDIKENWFVRIRPEDPQPLSYFLRTARVVQDLLSFACLHLCEATNISLDATFYRPDIQVPETADLSFMIRLQETGRTAHPGDFLFRYDEVEGDIGRIFARWFALAEKLEPVRRLYFSARYSEDRDVESIFTSTVQAVEVFHRRLYEGVYVSAEDFEQRIRIPLAQAIPSDVDTAFRESLLERIQFLNEFSLRKRLKQLYGQNKAAVDRLVYDAQPYLSDAATYRNFLTHYTGNLSRSDIDPQRLAMCTDLLQLLLEFALLRELGFADERIATLVSGCHSYGFRFAGWPRKPAR